MNKVVEKMVTECSAKEAPDMIAFSAKLLADKHPILGEKIIKWATTGRAIPIRCVKGVIDAMADVPPSQIEEAFKSLVFTGIPAIEVLGMSNLRAAKAPEDELYSPDGEYLLGRYAQNDVCLYVQAATEFPADCPAAVEEYNLHWEELGCDKMHPAVAFLTMVAAINLGSDKRKFRIEYCLSNGQYTWMTTALDAEAAIRKGVQEIWDAVDKGEFPEDCIVSRRIAGGRSSEAVCRFDGRRSCGGSEIVGGGALIATMITAEEAAMLVADGKAGREQD